ncbi:cysteine hydrolase family protein [Novosphingobium album (ex Hu et al. 2023)]|uniref:Cysteine hydrolase n=1 Tax=Novosphingobium album (ex Hu et al. 2023) TaxID=2930093 RepID=A0ABT0B5A1_9SPHN|nr:cysteine hydrolase [Novosphingobium album (ex Hu et al. 2023)]MCJ2180206.1 cysteine hydrolase [Novosphingobium album (ex Hu et al. 2023)]
MKKTLFLVMDMMNDLVAEDGFNAQTYGVQVKERGVLERTKAAIAAARAAGALIGYVRVGFSADYREAPEASPIFSGARKNGIFQLGTWGTEVHTSIAPQPQDFDIVKHRVSPFYATSLEAVLRANKVERIVMCGVSTNGVVHSGAREAHDRDYEVVILDDCCAGVTPDEHMHAIACMGRYGRIVESTEFDWAA